MRKMGRARIQLSDQPNNIPLSRDEPNVIPLTRCALLDAAVRKCFNSEPPIPMLINVQQKPFDAPIPTSTISRWFGSMERTGRKSTHTPSMDDDLSVHRYQTLID